MLQSKSIWTSIYIFLMSTCFKMAPLWLALHLLSPHWRLICKTILIGFCKETGNGSSQQKAVFIRILSPATGVCVCSSGCGFSWTPAALMSDVCYYLFLLEFLLSKVYFFNWSSAGLIKSVLTKSPPYGSYNCTTKFLVPVQLAHTAIWSWTIIVWIRPLLVLLHQRLAGL